MSQESYNYSSLLMIPRAKKRKRTTDENHYKEKNEKTEMDTEDPIISPNFDTSVNPDSNDELLNIYETLNIMMSLESPLEHPFFDENTVFADEEELKSPSPPPPRINKENESHVFDNIPMNVDNDASNTVNTIYYENRQQYQSQQRLEIEIDGLLGNPNNFWVLKKKTVIAVRVRYIGTIEGRQYFLNHVRPHLIGFGIPRTRMKKDDCTIFKDVSSSHHSEKGIILDSYLDGSSVFSIVGTKKPDLTIPNCAILFFQIVLNVGSNQTGEWRFNDGYRIGFSLQPGPSWFLSKSFKAKSRKPSSSSKSTKKRKKKTDVNTNQRKEPRTETTPSMNIIQPPPPPSIPRIPRVIPKQSDFSVKTDNNGKNRICCYVHLNSIKSNDMKNIIDFRDDEKLLSDEYCNIFEYPLSTVPQWFGIPFCGFFQIFPNGMVFGKNERDGWEGTLLLQNSSIRVVLDSNIISKNPSQERKKFHVKVRLGRTSELHIINYPEWSITHKEFGKWVRQPLVGTEVNVGRGSAFISKDLNSLQQSKVSKIHLKVRVDDIRGFMEIEDCSKNGSELFLPIKVICGDGVRYFLNYRNLRSGDSKRFRAILSKTKMEDTDETLTIHEEDM